MTPPWGHDPSRGLKMHSLFLVGIGSGNPEHITLQAIKALNACDLILIPRKGAGKDDLAELRREICTQILDGHVKVHEFDLPVRDAANPDYLAGVNDWHDAIAAVWAQEIQSGLPQGGRVGFLVWGDPSLYDSTLRIADRLTHQMEITTSVIPGITSVQALTAGHAIPLNALANPVTLTTGRQLRDHGWPVGCETLVVMLDGGCAFDTLPPEQFEIWWSAYAGMENEILISGPLTEVSTKIQTTRAQARAEHGWIMDVYLLRRAHG